MKLAISGSHGLVGSRLTGLAKALGHECLSMVRTPSNNPSTIYWNWQEQQIEAEKLRDVDAVIHLAGENIASGYWTKERKRRIKESRSKGTALIAETLAGLAEKPKVFICASAIGYYGDRGDQVLTEESRPGNGFLAETCLAWEAATSAAAEAGIRTIQLRIGVVLDRNGGALAKMLPAFRFGLGGRLGDGRQFMSWISLEDLCHIILFLLQEDSLSGPINAVAPQAVPNAEFTAKLSDQLNRPALLPVPAAVLRLVIGEMAEALLLSSIRVAPQQLLQAGYPFRHTDLQSAFEATGL